LHADALYVALQILVDIIQIYLNVRMQPGHAAEILAVHTQELIKLPIQYVNAQLI